MPHQPPLVTADGHELFDLGGAEVAQLRHLDALPLKGFGVVGLQRRNNKVFVSLVFEQGAVIAPRNAYQSDLFEP